MSTTEERMLEWLNENIGSLTRYRANPMNAKRTAIYDEQIEQQRTAISAIETCCQLKKSLFGKENVINDELVRMVLQLKSGKCEDREGAEKEEGRTMKTPEEIKKALKCHRDGRACYDCPYEQVRTYSVDGVTFGCSKDIVADALAYIEQLESRIEPVQHGYWIIPTPPDAYTYCKILCSVCNQVAGKHQTEYCPRCGAKMDLPRPRSNSDD